MIDGFDQGFHVGLGGPGEGVHEPGHALSPDLHVDHHMYLPTDGGLVDLGTDLIDTDHDGIPDWWELTYGLNTKDPSDALKDNDGDGLTNLQEYKLNSNPLNPDSNGNGINDAQELIYGRNPTDKVVSPFTDVTEKHPYYASIMNLFQRNILKGIPRGRGIAFGPDEAFTRAEFAKMMLDIFILFILEMLYPQSLKLNI